MVRSRRSFRRRGRRFRRRSFRKRVRRSYRKRGALNHVVLRVRHLDNVYKDGVNALDSGKEYAWTSLFTVDKAGATAKLYATLFDQYRIKSVTQTWIPPWSGKDSFGDAVDRINPKATGELARRNRPAQPPMVVYGIDRDLGDTPEFVWFEDLMNRPGFKMHQCNGSFSITVPYPTVLQSTKSDGDAEWNTQKRAPWLDTTDTDIPHYGTRVVFKQPPDWLTSSPETTGLVFTVVKTYVIEFRGRIASRISGSNTFNGATNEMADSGSPPADDTAYDGRDTGGNLTVAGS